MTLQRSMLFAALATCLTAFSSSVRAETRIWVSSRVLNIQTGANHDYVDVHVDNRDDILVTVAEISRKRSHPFDFTSPEALIFSALHVEFRRLKLGSIDQVLVHTNDGHDIVNVHLPVDANVHTGDGFDRLNTWHPADEFYELPMPGVLAAWGGPGGDQMMANYETVELHGESGTDFLVVEQIDKATLNGGWHEDFLYSEAWETELVGGQGDDVLITAAGGLSLLDGGWGNDVLDASMSTGPSLQYGGPDIDILIGGEAVDTLDGGAGNDHLFGWADPQYVITYFPFRELTAAYPKSDGVQDVMTGGTGRDAFYFGYRVDSEEKVYVPVWGYDYKTRSYRILYWTTRTITSTREWIEERITDYNSSEDYRHITDLP